MLALTELHGAMLLKLADSSLTEEDARSLGLTVYSGQGLTSLLPNTPPQGGFQIPYHDLRGKRTKFFRFRYLEFTTTNTKKGRPQRYTQPGGTSPELYFAPLVPWLDLSLDPTVKLYLTEGELKAACACKFGYPTLGLGGVWNFKSKKHGQLLLPAFHAFAWENREVVLMFDSDALHNPSVIAAENTLAKELTRLGARVSILRLPALQDGKTGVDDYLTQMGKDAFDHLLSTSARSPWRMNACLHALSEEVVVIKNPVHVLRYAGFQSMTFNEFQMLYAPTKFVEMSQATLTAPAKPIKRDPPKEWLEWPCRPSLERIGYHPGQPRVHETTDRDGNVQHELNAWPGWGCEAKKGSVKPWTDLLNFLVRKEPQYARWLEQWFAYPIQHPGAKLYSAVMMWGLEGGTGKTLLGETMKAIYGDNFTLIDDNDLSSTFNSWAKHKQFALGDEITKNESHGLANKLKGLITRTSIRINEKGLKQYTIEDRINYYFTSNHADALFINDKERRYFVMEIIGGPLADEFYATYDLWYKSPEGAAALRYHMEHLDLTGFNPTAAAPRTESKADMVEMSHGDLHSIAVLLRDDPQTLIHCNGIPTSQNLWTSTELFDTLTKLELLPRGTSQIGLTKAMKNVGLRQLNHGQPITIALGKTVRLWAVLNRAELERASNSRIISLYHKERKS